MKRTTAIVGLWSAVSMACLGDEDAGTPPEQDPEYPIATIGLHTDYSEAVASFGATVHDDMLYVYSGHIGETHSHSIDNLSVGFRRLSLALPDGPWEPLAFDVPVQSNSLVPYGEHLYRVGGMSAENRIAEDELLVSLDRFARYDIAADAWEVLPALPEGRSSHDAVVVGDTLYVFGGWMLAGGDRTSGEFHDTALSMDLAAESLQWTELEQPFRRRAVCVAPQGDHIYVLGGLGEDNEGSLRVDVFNHVEQTWSRIADVPGDDHWNAFGCAAAAVDGVLHFSGEDGLVAVLNDEQTGWSIVGELVTPRFFHRAVSHDSSLIVVGGADSFGIHLSDLELLRR